MERIHDSLYILHHLIDGVGQSSWELPYPVYRFDCGDLTGDSCPEKENLVPFGLNLTKQNPKK